MCYRYSVPGPDVVKNTFQVKLGASFEKRYHVGAFENVKLPVITNKNPKQVDLFNWGLIPFWVKDEKTAKDIRERTVNARSETIFENRYIHKVGSIRTISWTATSLAKEGLLYCIGRDITDRKRDEKKNSSPEFCTACHSQRQPTPHQRERSK